MRVLVGGIGYRHLRDHSFGVLVAEALMPRTWPADVQVEDLSYGPIAVVQRLQDDDESLRPERVIVVSAVQRLGLEPGTLTAYRWDGRLPDDEHVHTAVCEAVTGVIAADNTLVVAQHFGVLPAEVLVVEVQPLTHAFGDELSEPVTAVFTRACDMIVALATDRDAAARLPELPLGGGAPRIEGSFFVPQVSDVVPGRR